MVQNVPKEILHFLRNSLPSYMIPKEIIFKEMFPHTPSGKIDSALLRKEAYTVLHETHSVHQDGARPWQVANIMDTKTDLVFGLTGNQILVKVSPDKRRRGLYSLNFISDFIRKPL